MTQAPTPEVETQQIIDWSKSTYSGVDISVIATLNFGSLNYAFFKNPLGTYLPEEVSYLNGLVHELGTAQTISCQAHRPKVAVRSIGNVSARGYTRGPRTIAGSMIFTVLNKHSLRELCYQFEQYTVNGGKVNSTALPDQVLPIDLTFLFMNEYGSVSRMALYGVEFLNHGQTMSVEDLLLEEVVQFVARDMDPLADITDKANNTGKTGLEGTRSLSATDLFKSNIQSYTRWLGQNNFRRGH